MKNADHKITQKEVRFFVLFLLFIASAICACAQTSPRDSMYIYCDNGTKKPITEIGTCTIALTNGSMLKDCKVWEFTPTTLVYERDGSLHDVLISKIDKIEIADGHMNYIYFNEKQEPIFKVYGCVVKQQPVVTNARMIPDSLFKNGNVNGYLVRTNKDTVYCSIIRETAQTIFYTVNGQGTYIPKTSVSGFGIVPVKNNVTIDSTSKDQPHTYAVVNVSEPVYYTNTQQENPDVTTPYTDYYQKGRHDGATYYKGNAVFAGGVVSGIFFPYGWVSATIIAATPVVNLQNSDNPNNELINTNALYKNGYKSAAHGKKAGKTLAGFVTGLGIDAGLVLVFLAAVL